MNGSISLNRKLLDWEWWTDVNTAHLWITILLRANWKDEQWRGRTIKRGTFVTSYEELSRLCGLSVSKVRTSLNKLEMTGEITREVTNKNQTIIVEKYDVYQEAWDKNLKQDDTQIDTQDDKQIANKIAGKSQQMNNNNKFLNKENKNNNTTTAKAVKHKYGTYKHVSLTDAEYARLKEEYGDEADEAIAYLDEYKERRGYKCKNDNLTIRKWVFDAVKRERNEKKFGGGLPYSGLDW